MLPPAAGSAIQSNRNPEYIWESLAARSRVRSIVWSTGTGKTYTAFQSSGAYGRPAARRLKIGSRRYVAYFQFLMVR